MTATERLELLLPHVRRHHLRLIPIHGIINARCTCGKPEGECAPGKHPILRDWPQLATADEAQLRAWAQKMPHCNWGIAGGGPHRLLILDVDPAHGGDDSLAALEKDHGELPHTVEAITGSLGHHVFFTAPPDVQIPNAIGSLLGPGLDIRFQGGQVVAAHSLHHSGRTYEWEVAHHPDDTAIAPAPPWLIDLLTKAPSSAPATFHLADGPIPEGQRNQTLFRLGCSLRAKGISGTAIQAAVAAENTTRCHPPLPNSAITTIVSSVMRFPPGAPTQAHTEQDSSAPPTPPDAKPLRFQPLTAQELKNRPHPAWLIDTLLVQNTLAAITGAQATYKSFLALDMALSVATGRPFGPKITRRHPALYISAEGTAGLSKRIQAWEQTHGVVAPSTFKIITEPVQFSEGRDVRDLLRQLESWVETERPGLVIIDTLARCLVGRDENSAQDMGLFIEGVERLRRFHPMTIAIIHHIAKGSERSRGSSALPGAVDTIIAVTADDLTATLTCEKQKDFDSFRPLTFAAQRVPIGPTTESLAFQHQIESLSAMGQRVLRVLQEEGGELTAANWEKACRALGISEGSFANGRRDCLRTGVVTASKNGKVRRYSARTESEDRGENGHAFEDAGFLE